MSRYRNLTDHLTSIGDDAVTLSFDEIDDLVGGLPPSARKHASWWANSTKPSGQSRHWMTAGRKASVDMDQLLVTFRKADVAPTSKRERAARRETGVDDGVVTRKAVTLQPSGEFVRTSITYEWQHAGEIRSSGAKLEPPVLPARPGVYRIAVDTGVAVSYHVGETDNLFRSMASLRDPNSSQDGARPMAELLTKTLGTAGSARVEVITSALFGGDALDLSLQPARRLVESTALCELGRIGASIESP